MKIYESYKFSDAVVELLKKERMRQGISQYRMALDCELSKSAINYIENNKRRPTLYTIFTMASYLNINLSDIIKEIEIDFKEDSL